MRGTASLPKEEPVLTNHYKKHTFDCVPRVIDFAQNELLPNMCTEEKSVCHKHMDYLNRLDLQKEAVQKGDACLRADLVEVEEQDNDCDYAACDDACCQSDAFTLLLRAEPSCVGWELLLANFYT
jgi:hypothetical protein